MEGWHPDTSATTRPRATSEPRREEKRRESFFNVTFPFDMLPPCGCTTENPAGLYPRGKWFVSYFSQFPLRPRFLKRVVISSIRGGNGRVDRQPGSGASRACDRLRSPALRAPLKSAGLCRWSKVASVGMDEHRSSRVKTGREKHWGKRGLCQRCKKCHILKDDFWRGECVEMIGISGQGWTGKIVRHLHFHLSEHNSLDLCKDRLLIVLLGDPVAVVGERNQARVLMNPKVFLE